MPIDRDQDLVFGRADGLALDGDVVPGTFDQLQVRAGLPRIRFHDLRHPMASLMLANGAPTKSSRSDSAFPR